MIKGNFCCDTALLFYGTAIHSNDALIRELYTLVFCRQCYYQEQRR